MQSKQIMIAAAAGIIILLGAGGFLLLNKNKTVNQPNSTRATSTTNTTPNSMMQSSIKDIFASGKTTQCTFDNKSESGETKGTVYVAGNNAYGNFGVTTTNGKTITTYMIRQGDTFYLWGDSFPSGIKMTTSVDEMAKNVGSQKSSTLDPNQKLDYKCSAWAVDNSKFSPPSNIKFLDAGAMMQNTTVPTGSSQKAAQCSACAYLSGAAKTSCLAQYSCQ